MRKTAHKNGCRYRFVRSRRLGTAVLAGLFIGVVGPAKGRGGTADELQELRAEVRRLQERQNELQRELQTIRENLAPKRRSSVERVDLLLNIKNSPSKGSEDAKWVLVEFSDYQCPFCARHFRQTLPLIEKEFIAPGKVRYVFRDFPVEKMHPGASKLHAAAHCAGEQGLYWEMHEQLFHRQKEARVENGAVTLRIDASKSAAFSRCMESAKHLDTVRQSLKDAVTARVRGTPTFFLGTALPGGEQMKASWMIRGAQPYAVFKAAIENLLSVAH